MLQKIRLKELNDLHGSLIDVGKNENKFVFVKTSIIQKNEEDSDYYADLTDIRLTHISPKKVECMKGHKIRLSKILKKSYLNLLFVNMN